MAITSVTVQSQYDGPVTIYSLAADSALLSDRLTVIQTAEEELRTTLDEFYDLAFSESEEALNSLRALAEQAPPDLPPIEFTAPPFTNTPLTNPTAGVDFGAQASYLVPGLSQVDAPDDSAPNIQHSDVSPTLGASAPVQSTPNTPGAPTLEGVPSVPPNNVSPYTVNIPNAPTLSLRNFQLGSVPAPNLQNVVFNLPDPIEFDPVTFAIDDSILNEAVDRLNSVFQGTQSIPDYEYLMPEVFEVVGNMLSGNAVDDGAVIKDTGITRRVAPSLAKRNHVVPPHVSAYDDWAQGRITEFVNDSETLFLARFDDSVIVAAYSLAQEAESMAARIATQLYDLRRQLEVERARASLAIAQAVASTYQAYVALYEARVLEYNGRLEVVRGAIRALTAEVQARASVGEVNQQIAREFAQRESLKRLDVDLFAARVQAEAAKLEGYKAKIEAYEGLVANARANALSYSAVAAQYSGQVEQVRARYSAYETSAQAVASQNELAVAVQRGRNAEYQADAAQAEAAARRVSTTVSEYMAEHEALKVNTTNYLGRLAKSSGEFGVCLEQDLNDIRRTKLDNLENVIPREYLVAINDRFTRYANRASDVGWRVLQQSLRVSETLARAYARAYEALGRAAASVEVGRLGQFRGTYATGVAGSISATSSTSRTLGTNRSLSHSQSNSDTQSD